ncbi:MAG: hypothetical protein QMB11_12380 [Nonlabens sp.]|uniref:hypothetical protein n=1 Tax=Nonlabens sp. TaxID=1888209 RepID=UPI0035A7027C
MVFSSFKSLDENFSDKQKSAIAADPLIFDIFPVNVIIRGVDSFSLDVLYSDTGLLYIAPEDLFTRLLIPISKGTNGLEGIIGDEQQAYLVDFEKGIIKVGNRTITIQDKFYMESGVYYMQSSLFAEAFGISLDFNFRSLSIKLKGDFELPKLKRIRLEQMRSNIKEIKGEVIADTVLKRNYQLLKLGSLDWSVRASQIWKGKTENAIGVNMGTELLYGSAAISTSYNFKDKWNFEDTQYNWNWVDNDETWIRQAQVGKIAVPFKSNISGQVIGATVRNTPTSVRKAKGSYIINEITDPNWTVELYMNNILIDFTTADDIGSFRFTVPNVYGFSTLTLKYYGPAGEERIEERQMNVPYTIVAPNEFDYGLSAGIVQDSLKSRIGVAELNYGVNHFITVGAGIEYLSSTADSGLTPFANATFQPSSKLTVNWQYVYGGISQAIARYNITEGVSLSADYSKLTKTDDLDGGMMSELLKLQLRFPFKFKQLSSFFTVDYSQLSNETFNSNRFNLGITSRYKKLSASLTTEMNWVDIKNASIINKLSLAYRFKNNYLLESSATYYPINVGLTSYYIALSKRVGKSLLQTSFNREVLSNDYSLNLSWSHDFSFASTSLSSSHSKKSTSLAMQARGSLAFGAGNGSVYPSRNSSVGKGGVLIYPFLDINQNGVFDKEEHLVQVSALKVTGGKAVFNKKDFIVRISDLPSFTKSIIEFEDSDLGNIAWRFKHKSYEVLIDPNQFKRLYVPIISMGEISGTAYMEREGSVEGIARILINIYKKGSDKIVTKTLSEFDGYIYNMGLSPGEYRACVDQKQLDNLNLIADPSFRYFTIQSSEAGDIVDGLDFILREKKESP